MRTVAGLEIKYTWHLMGGLLFFHYLLSLSLILTTSGKMTGCWIETSIWGLCSFLDRFYCFCFFSKLPLFTSLANTLVNTLEAKSSSDFQYTHDGQRHTSIILRPTIITCQADELKRRVAKSLTWEDFCIPY